MPRNIAELTLDEVVRDLIGGTALQIAGGEEFSLPLNDSRAILAFYNQDRKAYWNPDKDTSIQDGEVDRVLSSLDIVPKVVVASDDTAQIPQKWKLVKIEAHRFRGLHRHCAEEGADPKPFQLELSAPTTLFRGFNGAGKTSLASAVCWCLTGLGHRSQGLPAPLHESIAVQVASDDDEAEKISFEIPPIVPVPTEQELVAVDGVPKVDTWVRLSFRSLIDGREVAVERRLERDGKKAFKTITTGLEKLGLPDLALQVGTLMPGIAAATRFDDKTTLSQAVSTLTGLRPLAHFGKRSQRLHDRLTDKYPKLAKQEKNATEAAAEAQKQTLDDLLKEYEDLPDLDCVVLPNESNPKAWETGLQEAEKRLKAVEDKATEEAALILGTLPPLTTDAEIKRFSDALTAAQNCFSGAALRALPSIQLVAKLGELQEADLSAAETVLEGVESEAKKLVVRLSDADRSDRLRLYGLVAKWHETVHPGHAFSVCPVCDRDLTQPGAIATDALLNQPVADALEQARKADAALIKTASEWERDAMRALRGLLPAGLQPFVSDNVPDDLSTIYITALSEEIFDQPDFPYALRSMAPGIAQLCRLAWANAPTRAPLPDAAIPTEIPDNEGLRNAIKKVRRAINLSKYRAAYADFAKSAVTGVIRSEVPETGIQANQRSVAGQLSVLKAYLDAATVFASVRRQLAQIKLTCMKWKSACDRLEKLNRAAKAVEPFKRFPALVHDQVSGLILSLDSQATAWSQRMYKAQFLQAPAYAGLDPAKSDGLTLLAAHGKHLVEAHHVMNASALRAYLTAFVMALWQQVWARSGGISTILMDDPQDLLDPGNVANLAATVPHLIAAEMNPLVLSNDFGFIPAIEAFVSANAIAGQAQRTEVWEFSAISTSKCTVSLAPVADEARQRCEHWQTTNVNDVTLARAFVHPVRVRIEIKLWDLLASDPATLKDPTLNDLLSKIANARNRGERPFNEEPFRKLIDLPQLKAGAPFRDAINKAHHGKADQLTPFDAEVVRQGYEAVFAAIDACWLAYARFMGRLPPDQAVAEVTRGPAPPDVVTFSIAPLSVIGRLAAHEGGAPLTSVEDAKDKFDLAGMGNVSLFTLRAPTLGLVAFPGQTLIVSLTAEVRNGDFAVVQTPGKTYARRVGMDKADPSRIALESMPSTNSRVPHTHFVQASSATLNKIVGVLFDETIPVKSQDEAIPATTSAILSQVTAAAVVAGDSAFPVAPHNGHVLLGRPPEISQLEGRILAVVTRQDVHASEHFAYLKRLGKQMPGSSSVYYLENVGQTGEGEFVQFPGLGSVVAGVSIVDDLWKVHGTIF
ncbi:AAA family ATPase [Devosia sp. MC521]|uniref:AAA family ATPase n=1 Tax=Devosia sp. MC521 TaxID=2759954 RepID=UPI0015F9B2A7|nr:AAA family ATPase [Devosia sp. MC521]MBJ6988203.1 AAA family ATPase [Devosia sp. MC521]QMW63280.1 AAA family ATPase [Devosia sp. MC521]